jgi:8-oxo-dGTP pyrophosphatase MutT (NUDIX family)
MKPVDPPQAVARRAIPRPPHNRAGGAAPWAGLPAPDRRGITLDRVRTALVREGRDVAGGNGKEPREPWPALAGLVVDGRPAAVLVPLFEEDGEVRVVLTVRSDRLTSHQGEVAFPGGRLEVGESMETAALREASEEVSLDPASVTVIGQLTAMPTVSSNSIMTPVVGTLRARPSLTANPGEVGRIFDVALADLVADGVFHEEWWSVPERTGPGFPDGEFPVWFFDVADETVWGATARSLMELLCIVLGVPVPRTLGAR